jgi:hypothetical protein
VAVAVAAAMAVRSVADDWRVFVSMFSGELTRGADMAREREEAIDEDVDVSDGGA